MRRFRADLHIHTCLSPCGDLTMSPRAIVEEAQRKGLDLIAICDHNSSENAGAVVKAARGRRVRVLPGMEVTSQEEVHIVALFSRIDEALRLQDEIYRHLEGENDPQVFGLQVVVDSGGNVRGYNPRLLIGATSLSVNQIVDAIHAHGGLAIAAHIDREGFGIIGQLGFIPPGLELDALEISPALDMESARLKFSEYRDYAFICSSDAHRPEEIGRGSTKFMLEDATFAELRRALKTDRQK